MSRERLQVEIQRHLDALHAEGKEDSATIIIRANARYSQDQDDLEEQI
jgi:hypothetical protein